MSCSTSDIVTLCDYLFIRLFVPTLFSFSINEPMGLKNHTYYMLTSLLDPQNIVTNPNLHYPTVLLIYCQAQSNLTVQLEAEIALISINPPQPTPHTHPLSIDIAGKLEENLYGRQPQWKINFTAWNYQNYQNYWGSSLLEFNFV